MRIPGLRQLLAEAGSRRTRVVFILAASMSPVDTKRTWRDAVRNVRSQGDSVEKAFLSDEREFLEPLMRFARGDMRDHIVSHKNDHGASYRRYGALQWRSWLKITFCEVSTSFDFRLLQHYRQQNGN